MFTKISTRWLLLAVGACTMPALAGECPPPGGSGYCPDPTNYAGLYAKAGGQCAASCFSTSNPAQPPKPALISCEYGYRSFTCYAYPEPINYGEFTYTWKTTGNLSFAGPQDPYDPVTNVNCGTMSSGTLNVVVRAPNGLTSTTTVTLYCR